MKRKSSLAWRASALLIPILMVILWQIIVRREMVEASQAAAPSDVAARFWELVRHGSLIKHALYSLARLFSGVAIGGIIGIVTSMILARFRPADRLLSPTVEFLAGIPVVIWMPFWVMFFGVDERFKIAMLTIATYFLVHLYSFQALRSVERDYMELADIYEKNYFAKIKDLFIPAATPTILTAIQTSLAFGWVVIFFVEYASAREGSEGLGWFINDARAPGKVEEEFAGLFLLAILAFIFDRLVGLIQKRLLRWTDTIAVTMAQEGA